MSRVVSTYRLQFHRGFTLADARAIVPYLHRLGVSHVYASPILMARSGSTHGYDVVDPTRLNPELGTEEDLARLVEDLHALGMGLVLDIVPNHMATVPENRRWDDVLAHGPASAYAHWFDIDWRAPERHLATRVLMPVLGDQLPQLIERGELRVTWEHDDFRVRYYDHSFPVDPATVPIILEPALPRCAELLGGPEAAALREAIALLEHLPRRTTRRAKALERRRRDGERALATIRELARDSEPVRRCFAAAVEALGRDGEGPERLRRLLDAQAYRLVHWRRAAREINYRRFFDINELVALSMEDPVVFAESHALVLEWVRAGYLDGLRIDHPDGLLDPRAYFERLRDAVQGARGSDRPFPVFVEKILSHGERLREEWPVAGTTGYDYLNEAEAVLISPDGAAQMDRDYSRITHRPYDFSRVVAWGKRTVLEAGLSAGVRRLAHRLLRFSATPGAKPPITVREATVAIAEVIIALPVYRTYVDERTPVAAGEDRRLLEEALAEVRRRGRASAAALDLLGGVLLGEGVQGRTAEEERSRLRFVQRFQQVSGPATAKGVEDTAFYAYVPLLSRNEVGGEPAAPLEDAVGALHRANAHRAGRWPASMLAATTHDTKRSADVRARIDVLSEIPKEWEEHLYRWRRWNRALKPKVGRRSVPDSNSEYLLYQTLVGAWPLPAVGEGSVLCSGAALERFRERIAEYMLKAVREAKLETSWVDPDETFESGLREFVEAILSPQRAPVFLADLGALVGRVGRAGLWNALSRVLIQTTSPGVPDTYQGDDSWSFTLVDPDNRRPVDFETRGRLLAEVGAGCSADAPARREFLQELIGGAEDGRIKLHVLSRALATRRERPDLFLDGGYLPLRAEGPAADRVVAYARTGADGAAITVAPRLVFSLLMRPDAAPIGREVWGGTRLVLPAELRASGLVCALSGEPIPVDESGAERTIALEAALGALPVALLLTR